MKNVFLVAVIPSAKVVHGQFQPAERQLFSPQLINPALVGKSIFSRKQQNLDPLRTKVARVSSMLSGANTISAHHQIIVGAEATLDAIGGGLGVYGIHQNNSFTNYQETALQYSYSIPLNRKNLLSIGAEAAYSQLSINKDITGYSSIIANGESPTFINNQFGIGLALLNPDYTLSFGLKRVYPNLSNNPTFYNTGHTNRIGFFLQRNVTIDSFWFAQPYLSSEVNLISQGYHELGNIFYYKQLSFYQRAIIGRTIEASIGVGYNIRDIQISYIYSFLNDFARAGNLKHSLGVTYSVLKDRTCTLPSKISSPEF